MGSTLEIEIDADLLALVEAQAARSGRPRSEVIADALRRGLGAGQLRAILDANRKGDGLSEDEAMALAIEELQAMRSERAADRK